MSKFCTKSFRTYIKASLFICYWACLFLIGLLPSFAQLQIVPLTSHRSVVVEQTHARTTATKLTLPFFDDFSTNNGKFPNQERWMPSGGILISNTHSTTQPTVNVAVFDGLNANGIPYSYENIQIPVGADTLTSLPIDLSKVAPADSLYLSFYYQAGGLIEQPDESDTLVCQFLQSNGQWRSVWRQIGGGVASSDFTQILVGLKERAYFHEGFQFRFISYGRITGSFDAWMVDYVYLDKNRRWNDTFEKDAAVTTPLTSYLKRFTAMPASHYSLRPEQEVATAMTATIYNLHNMQNVLNYEFITKNASTSQNLFTVTGARSEIILSKQRQSRLIPNRTVTVAANKPIRLQHHFKLLTSDEQNPPIPGVDLRRNDTISSYTDLTNYFAYDDGSAEYGIRMNRRLGRVVVRFVGNKADTLAGVSMYFVPFLNDIQGQRFAIHVYANKNGQPGDLLHQQAGQVTSSVASKDGFLYYPFQSAVAVPDTFYVGWLQSSDVPLAIGYDKNSLLGSEHVFTSLSQEWQEEMSLEGSLMIRPVTGGKPDDVVTGNDPLNPLYLPIYPNPASDYLYWRSTSVQSVEVFDIQGNQRKNLPVATGLQRLFIGDLQEGLYFVRLFDGFSYSTQKVFVRK